MPTLGWFPLCPLSLLLSFFGVSLVCGPLSLSRDAICFGSLLITRLKAFFDMLVRWPRSWEVLVARELIWCCTRRKGRTRRKKKRKNKLPLVNEH